MARTAALHLRTDSAVLAPPLRRFTPARPASVIAPTVAGWLVIALAAAGLQALLASPAVGWMLLPAAAAASTYLFLAYVLRVLLRSRMPPRRADRILLPLTFGIATLMAVGAPWSVCHPAVLALAWGLSTLVLPLATRWRRAWTNETRYSHVSLLAPSELAASDAIERLQEVPGLHVESVVVPGCDAERASRMLHRPVVRNVGGRLRLAPQVVVSCPTRDSSVGSTIAQLVALGHTISSETSVMRKAEGRVDIARANPLNLLMGLRRARIADTVRRVLDVVVSVVVLLLFAPIFAGVALAIWIDDGRPFFYRQGRVGRRGRLFPVIKFRTMRRDAENLSGPVFAEQDDPRVTRVGRFLRKYRIDELPQFVNVLLGQMTLVGPRPERPHFFNVLRKDVPLFELRTCVRPGITGWAQVRLPYAADSADARAKLEYDLYYVTHRSLMLDLAILLETVGVALSGSGSR